MHFIVIYLFILTLLFLLRLIFLGVHYRADVINYSELFLVFKKGFAFDNLVACYALVIPVFLMLILKTFKRKTNIFMGFQAVFFSLVFPVLLFLGIADIPYFGYFKNRISEAAFQWMGEPAVVLGMLVENKTNAVLLITTMILSVFAARTIYHKVKYYYKGIGEERMDRRLPFFIVLLLFCLIGMRGKIAHPLRTNDAFVGEDPVLNQAALNAPFTIMKSLSNKVRLIDDIVALDNVKKDLSIAEKSGYKSPIARQISYTDFLNKMNIVLVLMEGMSADYMGYFGNKKGLTPFLDSLVKNENTIFFTNAYSAGIHTNNGIFSSIYGFPALKRVRPMGSVPIKKYTGIPYEMKKLGYKNLFFSTAKRSFDNLEHFIFHNHFDTLIAEEDYDQSKIIGPYGVPDDYMFNQATNLFDRVENRYPFFATLLTTSNHDPYALPEYYQCKFDNKVDCGVSYADHALNTFFSRIKKSTYYNNTIFIFVADHGRVVKTTPYEMDLSNNHIPLFIHAPGLIKENSILDNFVHQIDIFPTTMGLINQTFVNNTMGVDVFNTKRPFAYFSADDKIGCVDNEWFYIYRYGGGETLHKLSEKNSKDYSALNKKQLIYMKNYALSSIQTTEWLTRKDLVKPQ